LVIARSYGIGDVLITCATPTWLPRASSRHAVVDLERVVLADESDHSVAFRRYWID
jgi:predicted acetyltransferase